MTDFDGWKWRGLPGHFICSNDCRFHLCTDIGKYRISTVGAMYREGDEVMQPIGAFHHYETMVFPLKDDQITDYGELAVDTLEFKEGMNTYDLDKQAERMHLDMCYKWEREES